MLIIDISETLQGLKGSLEAWKGASGVTELCINVKKTKMTGTKSAAKLEEGTSPCKVCRNFAGIKFYPLPILQVLNVKCILR